MTKKSHTTLEECYRSLPEKVVLAPKRDFINRLSAITGKSKRQVVRWIDGDSQPSEADKDIIAKELRIKKQYLFPATNS